MKSFVQSLFILSLMFFPQLFAIYIPKDLDYSQTYDSNSFLFIPQFGTKQGVMYFKTFEERVLKANSSNEVSTFQVHVIPTAIENGEYNSFIAKGWKDLKLTSLQTQESGCSIKPEILQLLKGYPRELQPKIMGGGYPHLCSAVFKVLDSEKDALIQLINTNGAIKIDIELALCEISSVISDTSKFWNELSTELKKQGKLTQIGFNFEIPLWLSVFEAYNLTLRNPELIPNSQDELVLSAFLEKFDIDATQKTIKASQLILNQPTTLCIPKLVRISK